MTIHEIREIIRRNPLIAYRREYHALVSMSHHGKTPIEIKIEFSLELSPLGSCTIKVKLLEAVDYPTLPILTTLKEQIHQLDRAGSLP